MTRKTVRTMVRILILSLILTGAALAQDPHGPPTESPLPGLEIVRFLGAEGKVVAKHSGKFLVLRQGDQLPANLGQVTELLETRMVVTSGQQVATETGASVPERIVIIELDANGKISATAFQSAAGGSPALSVSAPAVMVMETSGPLSSPTPTPPPTTKAAASASQESE